VSATWTVHKLDEGRFPYRVVVERDGHILLAVRAASPWPGPGQQVFCLREDGTDSTPAGELVEQAPVVAFTRLGRKLAIVLDRAQRKRCEFLFVSKPYRDGSGVYEQVFFRTESGIRSHRSRTRLEVRPREVQLRVVVDSAERYPWRFPGAEVITRRLPVGDYALLDGERMAAVVERKSFDNLLGDLGAMQAWHHALADLSRCERAALVIEAQYGDFLDERRLDGRWPRAHVARVLAEVAVLHPQLPVVYAGSRKLANQWVYRFFLACASHEDSPQLEFAGPAGRTGDTWRRPVRVEDRVREMVMAETAPFALRALAGQLEVEDALLRRILKQMEREGTVQCSGRGRGATWYRRDPPTSPAPSTAPGAAARAPR